MATRTGLGRQSLRVGELLPGQPVKSGLAGLAGAAPRERVRGLKHEGGRASGGGGRGSGEEERAGHAVAPVGMGVRQWMLEQVRLRL